jgi:hypothetical protein
LIHGSKKAPYRLGGSGPCGNPVEYPNFGSWSTGELQSVRRPRSIRTADCRPPLSKRKRRA